MKALKEDDVSLTAVDEHAFKGYCLKGRARITHRPHIKPLLIKAWEDKLTSRIRERLRRIYAYT